MPMNTFRHIVIAADTRTTETFMAILSAVWSAWILFVDHSSTPPFAAMIQHTGGFLIWGTWPALNCMFQIFSIFYKYPKLRCISAAMCLIYWVTIAYTTFSLIPSIFTPWMSSVFALIQLWILLHRTAAPLSK